MMKLRRGASSAYSAAASPLAASVDGLKVDQRRAAAVLRLFEMPWILASWVRYESVGSRRWAARQPWLQFFPRWRVEVGCIGTRVLGPVVQREQTHEQSSLHIVQRCCFDPL